MAPYDHGRNAALRGQYRVLACPDSIEQLTEWQRGYDSVPVQERGTLPLIDASPKPKRYRRRKFAVLEAK